MKSVFKRKNPIRQVLRSFGVDVSRYPDQSLERPRVQLLEHYGVDLVLDIGAARGEYVTRLREFGYSGRAFSFEPLPEPFAVLSQRSHLDPHWRAFNAAVGSSEGLVTMNVSENSDSSSVLPILKEHEASAPRSRVVGSITIDQLTVDGLLIGEPNVTSFLKLDVQGYEQAVLRGAESSLHRVAGVEVEMSLVPLYEGQILYQDMTNYLESWGFKLHRIAPGFSDPVTGKMLQMDAMFFKTRL